MVLKATIDDTLAPDWSIYSSTYVRSKRPDYNAELENSSFHLT